MLPKIDGFCNCLKQWQHRKLSLIGKITVIKSFAFPKLIYPLTVLPNPPESYIKKIKNAMFEFLWNKKPEKNNGMWKIFYKTAIDKFGGKLIFECNIQERDIKTNIFTSGCF